MRKCFPGLRVILVRIANVEIQKSSEELRRFKREVIEEIKRRYKLENLKDDQTIRAYRDFFWRIGVDPTKIRPASEALIRRALQGKDLPEINTLVDTYNLVSLSHKIPIAGFDEEKIRGDLVMRFAQKGERFLGINMDKEFELKGGEIVISDSEKLVAIYPYRDSERTKIQEKTKNVMFLICGVPGVEIEALRETAKVLEKHVRLFCGGSLKEMFEL